MPDRRSRLRWFAFVAAFVAWQVYSLHKSERDGARHRAELLIDTAEIKAVLWERYGNPR